MEMRTEQDSLGAVQVPASAWWGAQTQRAVENFPVSGLRFPRVFVSALGMIKHACAEVNVELGLLDAKLGRAIAEAAREVAEGKWDAEFPLDVFQTGSGTSMNMNANEVISNLCNERLGGRRGEKKPVDPNDHVNRGQSSNDVIPTAAHLSVLLFFQRHLFPSLEGLRVSLERKATEFAGIVKLGRTHLMDATPVRLGQEFGGYARQMEKSLRDVRAASDALLELAIGGTATGTGINTPADFGARVAAKLAQFSKIPVVEAKNHFEAQGARDDLVLASGALRRTACALKKIANDVRWMGSGPLGGMGEILIPDLQPGSSIMPGKVNPVMSEVATQVAAQVVGNDVAVAFAGGDGAFELNVFIPVMVHNVLQSALLLDSACRLFSEKCVDGIQANEARCRDLAEKSLMLVTALNPIIGYDQAAKVAKEAYRRGVSVKQVALEQKLITADQAAALFDLSKMTLPGATGAGG